MGNTPPTKAAVKVYRLPAEREGETEILRHPSVAGGPLLQRKEEDIKTLYDAFTFDPVTFCLFD